MKLFSRISENINYNENLIALMLDVFILISRYDAREVKAEKVHFYLT